MTFSTSSSVATFLVRTVAFGGAAIIAASAQQQDIPQVAIANGFETLVTALQAADLVGALASPNGPFTVFAPTDEAFDNLPDDLVGCLLNDIPVLTDILLYHVAKGKVLASQLSDGQEISTLLDGGEVTVDIRSDGVLINDAMVLVTDVEASNGVVHVINQVLVPPRIDVTAFLDACTGGSSSSSDDTALGDIPTVATNAGIFTTLVAALDAADLVAAVAAPNGPLTVFAPDDEAFANLPSGLVPCLLEARNKQVLTDVLLYHVASGKVLSSDLRDNQQIETLLGSDVTVDIRMNGGVKINDSSVIKADVEASNGVIHIIDAVLVPEGALDDLVCAGDTPAAPALDECTYLGVARSAGTYLTGPTHTCLCTTGGHWVQCRTNTQADTRKTIQQFVLDTDNLSTLETAVIQADLVGVLEGSGPFTLFAPTDAAFADVPTAVMNFLLDDDNKDVLGQVLKYHVTSGEINSKDLPEGTLENVDTVQGGNDQLTATKTCYTTMQIATGRPNCDTYSVTLDETSNAIVTDIQASNGIIHIINKVMIPPSLRSAVAGLS